MSKQIIWKQIFWARAYQVSVYGQVRHHHAHSIKYLKPVDNNTRMKIHGKKHPISRLVADAHLGMCPSKHKLIKIDPLDPTNNYLSNLKYVPDDYTEAPEDIPLLTYTPHYFELKDIQRRLKVAPQTILEIAIGYRSTPSLIRKALAHRDNIFRGAVSFNLLKIALDI